MRGDIPFKESDNDAIFRGNHVEAYAVAYFWERRHPEWTKHADGHTWTRDDAPWAACNTDSHGADDDGPAIVEAKSIGEWADLKQWGEEGTDQVPLDYWWQTYFQMWLTGIHRTYVERVGPGLDDHACYIVEYDPKVGEAMAAKLAAFHASLPDDAACPPPSSPADRAVFSRIYTRIDDPDDEWEVAPELRERFEKAHPEAKRWADELNFVKAELLAAMGSARYATVGGVRFARRQKSGPGMALYPHIDRRESVNKSAA